MTIEEFKEIALSFPMTIAKPHFDRTAFKIENKRIFATLHEPSNSANIKFNAINQSVFSIINKRIYLTQHLINGAFKALQHSN
jgi:hypothetical protein